MDCRKKKCCSIVMGVGAFLLVAGVFMTLASISDELPEALKTWSAIAYAMGAVAYAVPQMMVSAEVDCGADVQKHRLEQIARLSNIVILISALFKIEQTFRILFPYVASSMEGYNNYQHYVHNNWWLLLLISCVLQLYCAIRTTRND